MRTRCGGIATAAKVGACTPNHHAMRMICRGVNLSGHLVNHGQVKHIACVFTGQCQSDDRSLNICLDILGHGDVGAC